MNLRESILADLTKKVGDVVNGYEIVALDRAKGVCELKEFESVPDLSGYVKAADIPKVESLNLYSGAGAPTAAIGADGDYYEQLDAAVNAFSIYGPKAGGVWPAAQYRKIEDIGALATKDALKTEADTRKSADDALQAKITDETTARTAADTALDLRLVTAENLLNKKKEIRLNRSPTNTDVYEEGQIWADTSFSEEVPLRFMSMGGGVWQYFSQISLTKIRLYVTGRFTSYRSQLSQVRCFKDDGTQIPYTWFVWGAGTVSKPATGSAYNGGVINSSGTSGYVDIEVSSLFDMATKIARINGDFHPEGSYIGVFTVEFWYSNGSRKTYTATGYQQGANNLVCDLTPAVACRYGDAIAAAQGVMKTGVQLSDSNDTEFGRVNGQEFVSAFNRLNAPILERIGDFESLPSYDAGFGAMGDVSVDTMDTPCIVFAESIGSEHENKLFWDADKETKSRWLYFAGGGTHAVECTITGQCAIWEKKGVVTTSTTGKFSIEPGQFIFAYLQVSATGWRSLFLYYVVDKPTTSTGGTVDLTAVNTAIDALKVVDTGLTKRLDDLWLSFATQNWVNDQLAEIEGAVSNIPAQIAAQGYATLQHVDDADTALDIRIDALEARKEVKSAIVTTTLLDGSTLPVTTDFPGPSPSGFVNDGEGAVAGATSWQNNAPIGVSISQSGNADDEYEISAAFGAANPSARISFQVNGVWQNYTAAGVEAGTLNITEFITANWRGATLKVKGSFTGMVGFNTTGSTYIGPVIKRKRAQGYEVEGKGLALLSDIPLAAIAPDLTQYALNTALGTETINRTEADTALGTRIATLEANTAPKQGLITDFKTDAANNQTPQLWDAYSLSSALNPRQFADVNALLAFNTTGLQLYRHGYIKSTKESVYWDKDATAGDYKPNTGPGYWLKAGSPINEGQYFGTWNDQAGDSSATNGGHTCTRRLLRGTGIATANDSVFTLSGGLFKVRVGVVRHQAYGTWRNTVLLVDNAQVESMYSGHDGGNWPGGSVMEWVVDCTTVSRTVQVRRVGSTNNGNCAGWLSFEKIAPVVVSSGVSTRTPCSVSVNGGAAFNLFGGTSSRVMAAPSAGQQINSVTASAGLTVSIADPVTGALEVAVVEGTASGTITTTTGVIPAKTKGLVQANQGVAVNIGTIRVQMPSGGNRSWQVQSNTGVNQVLQIQNLWSDGGAGAGLRNITATPGAWTYVDPGWNFTNQGQHQTMFINDTTSGRMFNITCEVGGAYNNNTYSWFEL